MSSATFDFAPLLPAGLPPAAVRWTGRVKFDFTGGNNDADGLPLDGLIAAAESVLRREGRTLSTYGLNSGPQGYRALREFLVGKLKADAGIACTADDILITSGSLQALDLVNATLLARGDTVIIEEDCYQGSINRLTRLGVTVGRHPARPRRHADGRARRTRSTISSARASGRNTSTPSRPCRTRPRTILPVERRQEMLRLVGGARRADLRGRLLCRPDLVGGAPARALRHERARRRHPHRLVLEVDRAGAARRLHRGAVGRDVAHARAEDRRRFRRARADGAGGVLHAAIFRSTFPRCGAACAPSSRR